jgi:ATP-dependent Clp protease ATP-binding subunit ClpA
MFERFTEETRQVVIKAQGEARQLGHGYIGTEHLLLGLLENESDLPAQALAPAGIDAETVRSVILTRIGRGKETPGRQIPFTTRAKRALELGLREALRLRHKMIRPAHLLLGLLSVEDATAVRMLVDLGVAPETLRMRLLEGLGAPDLEDLRVVQTNVVLTLKPDDELQRLLREAGANALRAQRDEISVDDLLAVLDRDRDAASSHDEEAG